MKPMMFRDRWALVTGASSGLGRSMAKLLATEYGANVLAVARRADKLAELAAEVARATPGGPAGRVEPLAADLSSLADVDRVAEAATANGRDLYAAILNAGVTHFGEYHELSWQGFESMLATNVTGVVRLATSVLPAIERADQGGGLMLVSSMAGLTPVPYQTAYSATKAFLVNFGCGLYHELRGRNVSVTTFVPGGIQTEMTSGERFEKLGRFLMPVDACAREALEGFRRRRYLHAPGFVNRAGATLMRLLPQELLTSRVAATYRGSLEASKRKP
jgi:uncharacterized protein